MLALGSVIALTLPLPVMAQDRDAEVARLQAQLESAQTTIQRLEQRLNAVEARLPPEPSALVTTKIATTPAFTPITDLATLPQATASQTGLSDQQPGATWSIAPAGPIDRPLAPARNGHVAAFDLIGGTGGGRASFALTRTKDGDFGPPSGGVVRVNNDTINLAFSAPLAKEGDTPFATLDGLSSGTKLEFGYTRFRGRILTQAADSENALLVRARERCRAENPPYKPGCVRLDSAFMKRFFTPDELENYQRGYARQTIQRSLSWSLRAAVGYDEFSFYPVPTLAKATERKVSWSLGGGATIFPFDRASASIDIDYQRSFKAAKSTPTCPVAVAGAVTVSCVPGPLTGPVGTDKLLLAPTLRYLLPVSEDGLVRDLGFAPRIEFDTLSNNVAFDLPIYFAADAKDGLIGGFRFGYLTDGKEFKFGVFIGKSFSIFK